MSEPLTPERLAEHKARAIMVHEAAMESVDGELVLLSSDAIAVLTAYHALLASDEALRKRCERLEAQNKSLLVVARRIVRQESKTFTVESGKLWQQELLKLAQAAIEDEENA